jgi:hypothetical protein
MATEKYTRLEGESVMLPFMFPLFGGKISFGYEGREHRLRHGGCFQHSQLKSRETQVADLCTC